MEFYRAYWIDTLERSWIGSVEEVFGGLRLRMELTLEHVPSYHLFGPSKGYLERISP